MRKRNERKIRENLVMGKYFEKKELFYNNSEFIYSFPPLDLILNPFLKEGKRISIEKYFYAALLELKSRLKKYPLFLLLYIILFYKPGVRLIPSRRGVKQYFIPTILPRDKQEKIFCSLFAKSLTNRYEYTLTERLVAETFSILLGDGSSRTLRALRDPYDSAHRDRVYMHYRWNSSKDDSVWERKRKDLLKKRRYAQSPQNQT